MTLEQERKHYKRALKDLILSVEGHLTVMDALMQQQSTVERGNRIAHSINVLEFAKDAAKRFGIGTPEHHRKLAAQSARKSKSVKTGTIRRRR